MLTIISRAVENTKNLIREDWPVIVLTAGILIAITSLLLHMGTVWKAIRENGFEFEPSHFGQAKDGVREGWWFEVYEPRVDKVKYENLAGRYIVKGHIRVEAAPRPHSIGQYQNGLRTGMWLFWQDDDRGYRVVNPPDTIWYASELLVDQAMTGEYAKGYKVGPFDPAGFTPFVDQWSWPPLTEMLGLSSSAYFFDIAAYQKDEYHKKVPDKDKIEFVGDWLGYTYAAPWECLMAQDGIVLTPPAWKETGERGCPSFSQPLLDKDN